MSWLGLGLGEFGSQLGEGRDIATDWKRREVQLALEQAREKREAMMAPLQLQELQQRLRQVNQPREIGMTGTVGGGTAGITYDPRTSKFGVQPLIPGMSKDAVKTQIAKMRDEVPLPEYKQALQAYEDALDIGADPLTMLGHAQTLMGSVASKEATQKGVQIKAPTGGHAYEITDSTGKSWLPSDPNLPQNLKEMVQTYNSEVDNERQRRIDDEIRKSREALDRALALQDHAQLRTERQNFDKILSRGIAGHSFLTTVRNQVAEAAKTGGKGTTSGDLLIVEGFMQTMFGVDPKALRGSPKMMEVMLRQGGWDDRMIAEFNNAYSGGRLSQQVREQVLRNTETQLQSWDQAVRDNATLINDPQTAQKFQRYMSLYPPVVPTPTTPPPVLPPNAPPPPPGTIVRPKQ